MKVLVVSDTHGRDESLEMAVALEQPFDYLIHCGDVEGREFFIVPLWQEIMIFSVIFQERMRFCWKDIRSW